MAHDNMLWVAAALVILFLFQVWYFQRWQRKLWAWHCENFYAFDEKLTKTEQQYIDGCIHLSWAELLRPFMIFWDPFLNRLSFFTYSHRVKGSDVNSGRVAYGSAMRPGAAYALAQPVLKERKIKLPLDPVRNPNLCFGGLGWDCGEKTFRVYLRCYNMERLPKEYKAGKGEGGVSWTYDENGNLLETKTYKFPEQNVTYLESSLRGVIPQYDQPKHDQVVLNEHAAEVVKKYKEDGYNLDTIAKHNNTFTLYFPKI